MQQINASLETPPEQWDKECTLTLLRAVKLLLLASGDDSGRHHAAAVDRLCSEVRETLRTVGALTASMVDKFHIESTPSTTHPPDTKVLPSESVEILMQPSFEPMVDWVAEETKKETRWWQTRAENILGVSPPYSP